MSRAERRRAQKCEQKAKIATYNLTRAQLDALVREKISGELDRVKQEATNDARFHQLLNTMFSLCELADFHIEGRVVLKDKRTGKVWR